MKNVTIFLMACFILTSCRPNTQSDVSEELAINTLKAFYANLDVDTYGNKEWLDLVTSDFKVFEAGKQMDLAAFLQFAKPSNDLAETNWDLSAFEVTMDENTAHISYLNEGFFRHANLEVKIKWMESVLLVMEEGVLKMKFLNSNLLDRQQVDLNAPLNEPEISANVKN